LIDFDVLDSTVDNNIPLSDGETIETIIDVKKGSVDILVENENGTIAYQENNVENGKFTIDINDNST
jgi:hypothetical protein